MTQPTKQDLIWDMLKETILGGRRKKTKPNERFLNWLSQSAVCEEVKRIFIANALAMTHDAGLAGNPRSRGTGQIIGGRRLGNPRY